MKILVIGDACEDIYIYCSSDRFCPDAPVPVLKPVRKIKSLGMAGNVADNLKGLECEVDIISNTEKIKKTRYVHERTNHMFIRIDDGENNITPISKDTLQSINWDSYDAVVVSDYCKGFLNEEHIEYISKMHTKTFLDTKKQLGPYANHFTLIKINDVEYNKTKNTISKDLDDILVVTLGSEGARYKDITVKVKEVDVRDTSGAGDTFLSGLVYSYVKNNDKIEAIKFANQCASYVVQRKGTAKVNIKKL